MSNKAIIRRAGNSPPAIVFDGFLHALDLIPNIDDGVEQEGGSRTTWWSEKQKLEATAS